MKLQLNLTTAFNNCIDILILKWPNTLKVAFIFYFDTATIYLVFYIRYTKFTLKYIVWQWRKGVISVTGDVCVSSKTEIALQHEPHNSIYCFLSHLCVFLLPR